MNRLLISLFFFTAILSTAVNAGPEQSTRELFKKMSTLEGDWTLSPADQQEGKATQHKLVKPIVGTENIAMSFKLIGKGTTLQENLLPGNGKEMATMYHCDKANNCTRVLATHYCAKKNQPELIADAGTDNRIVSFSCDMNTELCNSNEGHVHRISHELTGDNHLKTTYTIYKDGKFEKDSIYHFDRTTREATSLAALELVKGKPDCAPVESGQNEAEGGSY